VAVVVKKVNACTSQEALRLLASCPATVARRNHWRIWELAEAKVAMEQAGMITIPGDIILAVAVLSILITAPLGAIGISASSNP